VTYIGEQSHTDTVRPHLSQLWTTRIPAYPTQNCYEWISFNAFQPFNPETFLSDSNMLVNLVMDISKQW